MRDIDPWVLQGNPDFAAPVEWKPASAHLDGADGFPHNLEAAVTIGLAHEGIEATSETV
jgi:hypothetical protein